MNWHLESWRAWIGISYILLTAAVIVLPFLRKRIPALSTFLNRFSLRLNDSISMPVKKLVMVLLALGAVITFGYCYFCAHKGTLFFHGHPTPFHIMGRFALRVFPYFMLGCLLAGVIEKYFRSGRIPFPKSMIGNGIFAAVIPVCSCAVVPMAQGMISINKVRVRSVIAFLMVAPILSPAIFPLSYGMLGLEYLIWRIVATFCIAIIAGVVVEILAGVKQSDDARVGAFSCAGCARASHANPGYFDSALLLGWDTVRFLLYAMVVGVMLGALFAAYLPPQVVGKYLSSGFWGMIISVIIGIPLYICSGEELLILSPLMEMGLPLGHAMAFTISGNAICLTSIAVLIPAVGKKATTIMIAALFFGSLAFGWLINLVQPWLEQVPGLF
jgi:uncharacterized membrane protein YraQ (UPF0718 family)